MRIIVTALALPLLSVSLVPACSSSPSEVDPDPDAATPPVIGGDRPVTVHVPASYQPGTPAPLVVLLHGFTASSFVQEAYFQLTPLSEQHGFIYAIPDGTANSQGDQFWNATDACCDFEGSGVDDSGYLRSVIDELEAQFTIDARRVFFVGHSNGGFMSYRMACDHADAIAAIASLAGAMFDDESQCQPAEPVAALQIHGTADATVPFDGADVAGVQVPSALQSAQDWATFGGCTLDETAGEPLDLDRAQAGAETAVTRFETGCSAGGHAELWTIEGGGHVPGFTDEFAPRVIEFLLAHPKP